MNRFGFTDRKASVKHVVDLYLQFTAGTSGAIPTDLFSNDNYCADYIESVTLTSTGLITIVLQDNYAKLLNWSGGIQQAASSYTASQASRVVVKGNGTDVTDATTPTVLVNLLAEDGTSGIEALANMQTGDKFTLHLELQY